MNTTAIGRTAESVAEQFLIKDGYKIVAKNWRTRWCEIDIIAQKDQTISFIEVKYRSNKNYGSGLEFITPKKLQQMAFAAQLWMARQQTIREYHLSAIELSGPTFKITGFLPDCN